jgi:hypothetical protein
MNYFRKSVPQTPVWVSNGSKIVFDSNDRKAGFYATDNPFVIGELQRADREGRGGVVTITAEQYDTEYVKKKGLPSSPSLPVMELRAGVMPDTITPKVMPTPVLVPSAPKAITMEPEVKEFPQEPPPATKPRVGKRRAIITS